jgi:hypothetical protein
LTVKTERATISFANPFSLKELDAAQPAGDYILETDHELIEGLSWLAYRRVATFLRIPRISAAQGFSQRVSVNQANLDAALMKDRQQTA